MRARATLALWGGLAAVLALVLVWRAVAAHRGNMELFRALSDGERALERDRDQGRRLRAEMEALQGDPLYVESQMRELRRVEAGERIVEPGGGARGASRDQR